VQSSAQPPGLAVNPISHGKVSDLSDASLDAVALSVAAEFSGGEPPPPYDFQQLPPYEQNLMPAGSPPPYTERCTTAQPTIGIFGRVSFWNRDPVGSAAQQQVVLLPPAEQGSAQQTPGNYSTGQVTLCTLEGSVIGSAQQQQVQRADALDF